MKKEFGNTRNRNKPDIDTFVYGKIPPQDTEAEAAILGVILFEPTAFERAIPILKHEKAFYRPANQELFAACSRVHKSGGLIDPITVSNELRKTEKLELVGGLFYLSELISKVKTSALLENHCMIVYEMYMLREVIRIGAEMVGLGYEPGIDPFEVINTSERQLSDAGNISSMKMYKRSPELMKEVLDKVQEAVANPKGVMGLSTGYRPLDVIINGLQDGDLIILAARPSMGKTAFALNIALNVSLLNEDPLPVGVFSLEMKSLKLTQRMVSALSKIDMNSIKRGKVMDDLFNRWNIACDQFMRAKLCIDDTSPMDIHQLRIKARKMVNVDGVRLIIIDYLQLMESYDKSNKSNREQEISRISRELKSLAKELNIPIIALSQLSREVEKRKEKKPLLSDLRESGSIEQDADIVMFLHNEAYQKTSKEVDPAIKHDATVFIAKNRDGEIDDLGLKFVKDIQRWFTPLDYDTHMLGKTDNLPF